MGTTRTDSRLGSTFSIVDNPDGSQTSLTIGRDGAVTRTTTRTDPSTGMETTVSRLSDGAEARTISGPDRVISISRDAEGVEHRTETVIERPDEATIVSRTTTDGEVQTRTDTTEPDGTIVSTIEQPDGTIETTTNRTLNEADGSTVQEVTTSDGTFSRSVSRPDGSSSTSMVDADGRVFGTEITRGADGSVVVVSTVDGEVNATVTETPVPGGLRRTLERHDGSPAEVVTTTTSTRTDEQGREVTEFVSEGPGLASSIDVQVGNDGEGFSRTTDASGVVIEERRTTFEADGTRVDEVLDTDGSRFVSRSTPLPGGGHETTTEFADGSTVVQFVDPDGGVTTTSRSRDGVETVTEVAADGSGSRSTTRPDGDTDVEIFDADRPASRGVIFDDDQPITGGPLSPDDASADDSSPDDAPADDLRPTGFAPRDVFDAPVVDRIREQSDRSDVDHSDPATHPRPPAPPAPPHIDVDIGPVHIEGPLGDLEIEVGPAVIEPAPGSIEVEVGPAVIEEGSVTEQAAGTGAAGVLGHPDVTPIADPRPSAGGEFVFEGAADGDGAATEAAGRRAGGTVDPEYAEPEAIDDDAVGTDTVRADAVRNAMGGDDDGGSTFFPGAGDAAREVVDDLEARAQWLSDQRKTPIADLAHDHAPEGLDPDRTALLFGTAEQLIETANPAGTHAGMATQAAWDIGVAMAEHDNLQPPEPTGPFPDDGTEDAIRIPFGDDADDTRTTMGGGDDDGGSTFFPGAGEVAREVADDLEARAQWLSDQRRTPLADLAREHTPEGLNPERVGLVVGTAETLIEGSNLAGTLFGEAERAGEVLGEALAEYENRQPVEPTGPFPDDGTENAIQLPPDDPSAPPDAGPPPVTEAIYDPAVRAVQETATQVVTGIEETATQVVTGIQETASQVVTGLEEAADEWLEDPVGSLGDYVDDAPPVAEVPAYEPPPDEPAYGGPVTEFVDEVTTYEAPAAEPAPEEPVYVAPAEPAYEAPPEPAYEEPAYEPAITVVEETYEAASSYVEDAGSAVEDYFSDE